MEPGIGLLVLQRVTPKCSETKGNFGAIPWQDRPAQTFLLFLHPLLLLFAQGANAACFLSLFSEFMRTLNPPRGRKHFRPCTFFENWYKVITNRAKMVSSHILVGVVTVTYGLRKCSLPHLTYMWAMPILRRSPEYIITPSNIFQVLIFLYFFTKKSDWFFKNIF